MNPTKNQVNPPPVAPPFKTERDIERELNNDALKLLLSHMSELPDLDEAETIPIEQAVGRTLASEVLATMDEPPYSQATANGFVLLPWGTALASPRKPQTFEVIGDIPLPSKPCELPTGKALRVKTGDYMSIHRFLEGHYAVVPESNEVIERNSQISITRFIDKHEYICVQGSVWKNGNILFDKGYRIRTRDLFRLASQGILKVRVRTPPAVALFSCGEELLPPTEPYRIGYKYDCTAYGLSGLIRDAGGMAIFCGIMQDRLDPFAKKLKDVLEDKMIQMVIISGGASVRKQQFTVDLLRTASTLGERTAEVIADSIKRAVLAANDIRPHVLGMPKGKPVICLSGEPKAAARGFRTFAAPVIARLLGSKVSVSSDENAEEGKK